MIVSVPTKSSHCSNDSSSDGSQRRDRGKNKANEKKDHSNNHDKNVEIFLDDQTYVLYVDKYESTHIDTNG